MPTGSSMPRYRLTLEYHGAAFAGWQRQDNAHSVQAALERALAALGEPGQWPMGAGRTDAGVHAAGQVAHVDLRRDWEPFQLAQALNHYLRPDPVTALVVERVRSDFHARFDAVERRYLYRMALRRAPLTLEKGLLWRVGQALDLEAMRAGAAHLVGRHDFTTFRASQCQAKSPVKSLDEIAIETVEGLGGAELRLWFRSRSFLHNQVRGMVGTLERVGAGAWAPERVAEALAARDRAACGPVAPAHGLYLMAVRYPPAAEATPPT